MERAARAAAGQSPVAVRLIAALVAAITTAACANLGAPPGGPLRTEPPRLVSVSPESGAVNVRAREVVFQFDAVVSDRPSGQAASLASLFLVSPQDGTPRVDWERSRIEVRPRRGFRPNTAYSVTLLPGVADLRGNVSAESRTVIFSTGPVIPAFAVRGRVFEWLNERVAPQALVEVLRVRDSTLFIGTADSTGQFDVGPLDTGRYAVRTWLDANRNRARDPQETWDSTSVTITSSAPYLELLAAPRDTVGPRLLTVEVRDSVTLHASFDRPLDPGVTLTPASFRILTADSTRLVIARVTARARGGERSDSLAPGRDSAAAQPPVTRPAAPPPAAEATAAPRPSLPAPTMNVVVVLDHASALQPGRSYRVVAVNARGITGVVRTSERVVTAPPRDTTRATPP